MTLGGVGLSQGWGIGLGRTWALDVCDQKRPKGCGLDSSLPAGASEGGDLGPTASAGDLGLQRMLGTLAAPLQFPIPPWSLPVPTDPFTVGGPLQAQEAPPFPSLPQPPLWGTDPMPLPLLHLALSHVLPSHGGVSCPLRCPRSPASVL